MSVEDRSCFSYQVAAGNTTSESRVELVIRKSADTSRSSLPSGACSCQVTSFGREVEWSEPRTLWWVPSRCLRKYSSPLAEEPSRLERHSIRVRGQFCGASTSSTAKRMSCALSRSATHRASSGASPRATPSEAASATSREFWSNCGKNGIHPMRVDLATTSAVCMPFRCPSARGDWRESEEYPSERNWSVCMYQNAVPIMNRGGRVQSVAAAIVAWPVIGRVFSWPT
ncbi:hypothetical protein AVL61_16405 [Kocuria rosea subsp. polaris]|uniref:Uncharacterized protein n=1 Tax=Kocuria rosea subsp. polaris TaxID=136273 RepID=A0A0W8IHT2_KOCRO|nr:hypothetical protein AVL61_16405 [Kocuria polaris]